AMLGTPGQGIERFGKVTGIDLNSVDSLVAQSSFAQSSFAQSSPPRDLLVLSGDGLGAETLSDGLIEQGDVLTDVEGEDLAVNLDGSAATLSPVGRPTRIRAVDGAVALGATTESVTSGRTDDDTLAARAPLVAVAASLDDSAVFSAVVAEVRGGGLIESQAAQNLSPEQAKEVLSDLDQLLPQGPYDAVGLGWSLEDGQARIHVAYHFVDGNDAASAGAKVLAKAWAESPSLPSGRPLADFVTVLDSASDGDVATITLSRVDQGPLGVVLTMLSQREPVFVSR
ncbi:MAG: hypothetical protein L0H31_03545, partial [Nocardioidaceae bacterium]|nr:hypothetical protein [Nocardioidaceae bacterium]